MPKGQTKARRHGERKGMKRKIVTTLVFGILLIGVISAGLVSYLSNSVTGSVTVEGPVFYAASSNRLLMNAFDGSNGIYDIVDGHNEIFLTTSFGEPISFYQPSMNMYVKAKILSGTSPKSLNLEFGYFDSNGNLNKICENQISITSSDFNVYETDCAGNSALNNVNGFYYRITGMATPDVTCEISVDGNTKAEMSKE